MTGIEEAKWGWIAHQLKIINISGRELDVCYRAACAISKRGWREHMREVKALEKKCPKGYRVGYLRADHNQGKNILGYIPIIDK